MLDRELCAERPESIPPVERSIEIDWERAELVLGLLMNQFNSDGYPYNQDTTRVPHDPRHMPELMPRDGTEHAMFLWTVCYYMRGGIKSVDAVKRLAVLYDKRPELFVCEVAALTDPTDIATELSQTGLGFQKTVSNAWVENARRLQDSCGGDPRKLFDGVTTYDECLDRIKNDQKGGGFVGFQEKMVSMITYYLMDDKLIQPFVFPLPVDLHVLRVSVANELIKFPGYELDENILSDETLRLVRELYYKYALEKGVDPLRLCDAVWLLSESMCGKQPGNITREPEGRRNRNGRQTLLVAQEVDTNDQRQRRDYYRSCGQCILNETCAWNVPGKVYYVQGELRRRKPRIRFPDPAFPTPATFEQPSLLEA